MTFLSKLQGLFRRKRFDDEMNEEMRLHLEMLEERNVAAGMSEEEARFAARREFGGVEQVKEVCREQRGWIWLEQLGQDLRYAVRQLRRSPGFAIVAISTLTIGIGAATTIFSIVNSVILRPLDYPDSDRLFVLHETYPPNNRPGPVTWGSYYEWAERVTSFSAVAASHIVFGNLAGAGDPERVTALAVTPNYFNTLGVQPILGRGFRSEEASPGKENVLVITHWFWLKKFGGRADVIDQSVRFSDRAFTIVGVLPRNAQLDTGAPVFIPAVDTAAQRENRYLTRDSADVVARLKPGATLAQATSELEGLASAIAARYPATNRGRGVLISPLLEETIANTGYHMKGVSSLLFLLLGAVGFLLLIACINIANLLLARASARRKEIAMRSALGASRGRIVRQLLCESLLVAVLGGGVGTLFAYWAVNFLQPLIKNLPRADEIAVDGRALAFGLVVTLVAAIGFGFMPAWQAARVDVIDGIKDGGKTGEGRRSSRLRSLLIVAEVALALMLLTGAGLLVHSFVRLQQVELGFRAEGVFANRIEVPAKKYETPQQRTAFVDQLVERISGLPEVNSVAFTSGMPIFGSFGTAAKIAGRPEGAQEEIRGALYAAVTPGYFGTLGIPLLRGRDFSPRDTANASRVAIISASLAEKYFPKQDAIGQRISLLTGPEVWREIVGVVGDVNQWGPASETIRSTPGGVYEPFSQNPTTQNLLLVVHTSGSAADLPIALRSVTRTADPDMALSRVLRLTDGVIESTGRYRLSTLIFAVFAGVALLLAAIGIYGVMAYSVTQRTNEIGVRMALGARYGDILRLVFGYAGKLIGMGLVIGSAGSLAGSRLLHAFLFKVDPRDAATFGLVAVLLVLVALVACWWPARRAAKVDPMVALRCE